jgi:hypothetical protein
MSTGTGTPATILYVSTVKVPIEALTAGFVPKIPSNRTSPAGRSYVPERVTVLPAKAHVVEAAIKPIPFAGTHEVIVKSVSGYVITISQGFVKGFSKVIPIFHSVDSLT